MEREDNFKEKFTEYRKRLQMIKNESSVEIKEDLSNFVKISNMRGVWFSTLRDLIFEIVSLKETVRGQYYDTLNELAGNYIEKDIPLAIKANSKYKKYHKRKVMTETLLEESYDTQRFIESMQYSLKNVYDVSKFLQTIGTGR